MTQNEFLAFWALNSWIFKWMIVTLLVGIATGFIVSSAFAMNDFNRLNHQIRELKDELNKVGQLQDIRTRQVKELREALNRLLSKNT